MQLPIESSLLTLYGIGKQPVVAQKASELRSEKRTPCATNLGVDMVSPLMLHVLPYIRTFERRRGQKVLLSVRATPGPPKCSKSWAYTAHTLYFGILGRLLGHFGRTQQAPFIVVSFTYKANYILKVTVVRRLLLRRLLTTKNYSSTCKNDRDSYHGQLGSRP